jgi:ribulose-phosphate 3-epimerase
VTFHPETSTDAAILIDRLHEQGAQVGLAVKPGQSLDLVTDHLADIDMLLVMTVEPGFGGQAFMEEVVPKIAEAAAWRSEHGAGFRIEVDGGIAPDTIAKTARAGADTFVAGSAVFNKPDRAQAVKEILEAAEAP